MPLYDTSIFVGHIRRNPQTRHAIERLRGGSWPVMVSTVTLFEIHWGCVVSKDPARMRFLMDEYLSYVSGTLPVDELVAHRAAEIQAQLRQRNQMIDIRDLFIAATALIHGLSVCTLDIEHFSRVPGLVLEEL